MIFKSLYLQKPLLKSQKLEHVMPAGAFGAVRPVGAILPTATAAGPSHSRSHGRLRRSEDPCRPVMFRWWIISVSGHANMTLTWTDKWQMIPQRITMPLDKWDCTGGTSQRGTAESFTASGQSPSIFDPLDNGNLALRINYQKVSRLKESQEVASKWGLGRSASHHTSI